MSTSNSNQRFTPPFSVTQQKVLAMVPKVTSFPSIVASIWLLVDIIRLRDKNHTVYHRLLFMMACMDLVFACKSFVSTWPIPQQTLFVWGNRGTFQTCDVAGFLGHGASLASAVYNGSLAVYFALTIVGNYTEHTKPILWKWLRMEPLLHFVPLAIGWGTAAVMLSLDYFRMWQQSILSVYTRRCPASGKVSMGILSCTVMDCVCHCGRHTLWDLVQC